MSSRNASKRGVCHVFKLHKYSDIDFSKLHRMLNKLVLFLPHGGQNSCLKAHVSKWQNICVLYDFL